ncbi:MAG: hypothetical protein Q9201_002933 [Fulgogasparrea decipioides]
MSGNNFASFPPPSGLPPLQTLVRPEQIPNIPNVAEERKAAYIQGVTGLWECIKTNPPESQNYKDAYKKLHDVSESLKRNMNQARATQNGPRTADPTQQSPDARPIAQQTSQAPPGQPAEQFSQKVMDTVRRQTFLVPAEVAALGPQRTQAYQREIKQRYALALQKYETSQLKLQELKVLQQTQEGKTITPQDAQHLNAYKDQYVKMNQQAKEILAKFKQSQDAIRAMQKHAGVANASSPDVMKGQASNAPSTEHPQSTLAPQAPNSSTVTNTVSDHQGQAHTVSSALDAARNHPNSAGRPNSSADNGGQVKQGPVNQAATSQAPESQAAATAEHSQTHQNMNHASGAPPQYHSPTTANPATNMPQGPHPLSHQAAISQSAKNYSQHTYQNPATQSSSHAHPQLSGRDPQNSNNKMPIPKDLKVPQPQPVAMGPSRPTLTGGPSNGAMGSMGQPAIQKHPGYVLEGDGERVLGRKKLEELVRQVTGGVDGEEGEALSAAAEETLLDVADDFVDQVVTAACKLAKLRSSQTLELRDIQLVLERNHNIRIPGYASDELRTVKKLQPTPGWTQKLAAVQAAKVTGGKPDI